MLKINYRFTALQPIHTGSDQNLGTFRELRRQKITLPKAREVKSKFHEADRKLKRQAIALMLLRIWDRMENKGRVTIYDEVTGHLLSATSCATKEEFLNRLCEKLGIRSVTSKDSGQLDLVDILDLFDDYELMETIKREYQYIMVVFRKLKDDAIEDRKHKREDAVDEATGEVSSIKFLERELERIQHQEAKVSGLKQVTDQLPYISGNSIRGMLRRTVMYDFCRQTGIEKLDKDIYHQLFTGGNISGGDGHEDIAQKERFIELCPMIGLFGSAIGNMTIQGSLRVGMAAPACWERGTGEQPYRTFLDVQFGTRHDTAKLEKNIEVHGEGGKNQMKYEYEVFSPGTPFIHKFGLTSDDPLMVSTFYRMLKLFKVNNYLCAKASVGNGEVDLSGIQVPADGDKLYLDYLEKNRERIQEAFATQVTEAVEVEEAEPAHA